MKKLIWVISLIFLCSTACFAVTKGNKVSETKDKKVKMILDVDMGIDDAMALAYALADPKIELIGVVTSFGNVTTEESAQNSLNMLNLLNHNEIPVYIGASRPISQTEPFTVPERIRQIHGNNGVGNVTIPATQRTAEKQTAVDFMIESAKKYGKDLYIVAVGPMTNLNEATKKDPEFKNRVGKIVIMGGALLVDGNITPVAEANIYNDPIAANELFTSGTPLTMVGLDVTLRTSLTKKDTQHWRDLGTASGKAYADIVDHYIGAHKTLFDLNGCCLHDPLAVAVAVHPDLVKVLTLPMRVGTNEKDWGRTVAVSKKMNDPNPNVSACVDLQIKDFMDLFMGNLDKLFKAN